MTWTFIAENKINENNIYSCYKLIKPTISQWYAVFIENRVSAIIWMWKLQL